MNMCVLKRLFQVMMLVGACGMLLTCVPLSYSGSVYPAVAYDEINRRYIAVYVKWRSGDEYRNRSRIYGVFIDSAGGPLGGEFAIAEGGDEFFCPAIAYDRDHGTFLVVWNAEAVMHAQFVNTDGTLAGPTVILSDAAEPPTGRCSSAAYDPVQGMFLAAWGERNSQNHDSLYARLIAADGTLPNSKFLVSADGAAPSRRPSVAYDSFNQRYLAVWDTFQNLEIKGRLINSDGSISAPEFTIYSANSTEFWPRAVYDSVNGRFLVTWAHFDTDKYVLLGQLLNADGTPYQAGFTISSPDLDVIGVSSAFDPVAQNYFVVFGDYDLDHQKIHGQIIPAAGPADPAAPAGNILLSYADYAGDRRPSVAFDSVNQRYFAAWSYGSGGQQMSDIHGRHMNADGTPSGQIYILSNGGAW